MQRLLAILWLLTCLVPLKGQTQEVVQYDLFLLEERELYWRNTYSLAGNPDSLIIDLTSLVQSKSSKFRTSPNKKVVAGEFRNYKVNPENYGRTRVNTPRIYWDGDWKGKFIIEVLDNGYRVTVYDLVVSRKSSSFEYHRTKPTGTGKFVDRVTQTGKQEFQRTELQNLALMSLSLKDFFRLEPEYIPQTNQ